MIKEEILKNIAELYPVPKIVFKLTEALTKPGVPVDAIEYLIAQDPVFTARMLNLANSAFYSPLVQIKSIKSAIIEMGFSTIKNLAIQVCIADIIRNTSGRDTFVGKYLLAHSMAVRHFTKAILEALHADDLEEVFSTSATLHDIGLIIEYQLFRSKFEDVLLTVSPDSGSTSYFAIEEKAFGFSHAQISTLFCQAWNISDVIAEPIQYHHDYTAAPERLKLAAAIINLADVCALQRHIGFFYPYWEPHEEGLLEFLDLKKSVYDCIARSFDDSCIID